MYLLTVQSPAFLGPGPLPAPSGGRVALLKLPPLSKVPITGWAETPPSPRPCTWGLLTLMALLSLSAKKAGVFLRHFTGREKQHKLICRKLSQGDTGHTATS